MKKIMTVIAAITLLSVFNRAYADTGIELVKYDVSNQEETTVVIGENQYNGTEMPAYIPATVADMDLTGINNAPSAPDSIIGLDDRERLSETQVAVHPYSTVLLLLVGWDTDSNGTVDYYSQVTGTMVGPNTILTAGHCIYKQESGWPDELRVYPFVSSSSLNGKTYYSASAFYVPSSYQNGTNTQQNDWGIISLPDTCTLSDNTGYMGFSTSESLLGKSFVISGYPGDDSYYQNKATGTVLQENDYECYYDIDTYPGESGAAIFSETGGILWGVHAYGTGLSGTYNHGCKITDSIYNTITAFRDEYQDATTFMYRLYKNGLNRDPDVTGLNSWVHLLRDGLTGGKAAARGIYFSTEFQAHNYNDSDYVIYLYKGMLNRMPDTSGYNAWVGYLQSGGSRLTVFNGIADSQEFINMCTSCGISH